MNVYRKEARLGHIVMKRVMGSGGVIRGEAKEGWKG